MKKSDMKNIQDILALTPMQEGMLFHYLKDPGSIHYFEQLALKVSGEINFEGFRKAWDYVVQVNEMLRTFFRWEKLDKPTQVVLKQHSPDLDFFDLSTIENHIELQKQLEKIKLEDRKVKFDLGEVPFRVILCKVSDKDYHIVISNHHILYDGWSTGIILKEFFQTYEALEKGDAELITGIKPPFREFIRWQQSRDQEQQKEFWEAYLKGFAAPTRLPIKRKGIKQDPGGAAVKEFSFILGQGIKEKLDIFLKERRVTLAAFFYCAWGILLQKYCGSDDVVFGTTVSGRSAPINGIENMVGLFINTLPLRVTAKIADTISDLLLKVNETLLHREKYENTPLVDINEYSRKERGQELFDTLLVIENYPLDHFFQGESKTLPLTVHSYSTVESTNYDLTIIIALHHDIEVRLLYPGELFARDVISRLSSHFIRILEEILVHPHLPFHVIDILSGEEKKQLLLDFNDTNKVWGYPCEKSIHQLFEEQVERTPYHTALVAQGAERKAHSREGRHVPCNMSCAITYKELNEKSNQLAILLQEKGVKADVIVGIMIERSVEMIIGVLGILKAGGAYLPIDPDYPRERMDYMLADSGAKILLTPETLTEALSSPFSPGACNLQPAACLAYIIYTSGSTGHPKGVMVDHPSVVNLLIALHQQYPLKRTDTDLLKTSYLFDVSVTELFGWFLEGGRLAILEKGGEKDPAKIVDVIERVGVTHINFVPSMFNVFVQVLTPYDAVRLSSLKYIFLAGEALLPELVNKFRSLGTIGTFIPLENIYGPTEGTVYSSSYSLVNWDGTGLIPIGKPLPNMMLLVLDKRDSLQPIGVPGELCIGGVGVARGYLNRPELTAEKFLATDEHGRTRTSFNQKFLPGGPGGAVFSKSAPPGRRRQKIYKTGDLARWLSDGNIEYLGRMDHQVKIRGFRIEPGEIENQLVSHRKIKEALVVPKEIEGGEKYLCAYIIPAVTFETALLIGELKEYLSRSLPDYMIPLYFMTIDNIPRTLSGKVDRKMLPDPVIKSLEEYVAPGNEKENALVDIWAEVLGIDRNQIGISDNFFELGGHSLKVAGLVGRIHKKLNIEVPFNKIFQAPTVKDLAQYISQKEESPYCEIPPLEEKEYYLLSSAQKRLFVLQQMDIDSTAYNICGIMNVEGPVEKEKFELVFRQLINRHESLRTSFHVMEEQPVQKIHDKVEFEIEYYGSGREGERETGRQGNREIAELIKNFIRPFDLSQAPLLRVGLLPASSILMLDMHHIISDGTSMGLLVDDFIAFYKGEGLSLLRLQYRDYAQWQKYRKKSELIEKQEAYWHKQFKNEITALELPIDFARLKFQDFAGSRIKFDITPGEARQLKALALENQTTLYTVLLSLFNVFLAKIIRQEIVVVGTAVAGRRHADLEQIIGMFVNTLVLTNYIDSRRNFNEFLEEVHLRTLEAFANQDYPFEELVESLGTRINRDPGRNPLFDVMFDLQPISVDEIVISALKIKPYHYDTNISKFDLMLQVIDKKETLWLVFEYSTKLFKETTIRRFIEYFRKIVAAILEQPTIQLSEIEIISKAEKDRILFEFNNTGTGYPKEKLIHHLFNEEVKMQPDRIAVVYEEHALSYRALEQWADRLAVYLRDKGVTPGEPVGIMLGASLEVIVGVMAILKAGGAYLPIDPGYPQERKQYILLDSNTKILLSKVSEVSMVSWACEVIDINDIGKDIEGLPTHSRTHSPTQLNLAYIIYTSGSTGRPKGVMVEHQSVVRLVKNTNFVDFKSGDRILQTGALEFDASTFEIWGALLNGLALYLAPRGKILDPGILKKIIVCNQITTMWLTSPLFNQMVQGDIEIFPGLRNLLVGGDVLSPVNINQVRKRFPQLNIINGYGPTENTTFSTTFLIDKEYKENIPIGKPIANSTVYIVDKSSKLQPIGIAGELLVGGDGVARGYLNNPGLTVERFIKLEVKVEAEEKKVQKDTKKYSLQYPNTPIPHYPIYMTGDLGRWLPDGNIEFLGRVDHQVKIRGFRIELGEIENRILGHEQVKEAVVLDRITGDGDKYLCAYIVSGTETHNASTGASSLSAEIKEYLLHYLPEYMIPMYFVQLDKMPLVPHGKIHRAALPLPEVKAGSEYAAPRDEIENRLVRIWSEVLGLKPDVIGIHDDFFNLGGHSLKAVVLGNKIHQTFGVRVTIQDLYQFPAIPGMARLIKNSNSVGLEEIEKQPEQMYYEVSYSQRRLWYISKQEPDSTAFNMPVKIPLYETVKEKIIREVLEQLMMRHESLRTSIKEINEEPVQVIESFSRVKLNFEVSDESQLNETERESKRSRLLMEEASHFFNLEEGPLFRAKLVKWQAGEYDFVFNIHHIISDGWSMDILRQEFYQLYKAHKKGMTCEMEPLRIQYKDYAAWQNQLLLDEGKVGKAKEFWKNYLSGTPQVLDLPYDFSPGAGGIQNKKTSAYCFVIEEGIVEGLRSFAREQKGSLFMVLLSSFNILLSHITGQEEILMAVPAAARQHWELKHIIGVFVNTLILRTHVNKNKTFNDLFHALQANTFDVLEYQDYPLELIFSELKMKYPKIPVFFNMVNVGISQEERLTDLNSYHIEEAQDTKFEMVLYLTEYKNAIQISCHYFRELFMPETIERIMRLFTRILENISKNPGKRAKDYCISKKKKNILGGLKKTLRDKEEKAGNGLNIKKEVKESQQRLSKVNIDFLDYVEKNPGCFKKSNFQLLELNDDLFRLQPWPTFINAKSKALFREVGVKLFDLVKQIPARVFGNDLQKMSAYYQTPVKDLANQLEGVSQEHIDNLVGRGDFILTSNGLKCIEYNVSPSLGGWQVPFWESLYLKTPILAEFLKKYGVKTKNENLLGLFLAHVIRSCLGKLANNEDELNVALVMKGYEEGIDRGNWLHSTGDYLNLLYKEILQREDKSLTGEVLVCDYQHLCLEDDAIFYKGKRIHGLTEGYNGVVSLEVMKAFKAGNICLFNGPITNLISNKLNMAVLSDPVTNAVFTDEDRKIIDAHVPWTRKTSAGPTTYKGETIDDLEQFMLSNRERLVIKPGLGYGGQGVMLGNKTRESQWQEGVKIALHEKDWVVQELVETSCGVYLVNGSYEYHEMAWGIFIFGSQYSGSWLRVMPGENNKGVINCHQGAAVSVIFEVDE